MTRNDHGAPPPAASVQSLRWAGFAFVVAAIAIGVSLWWPQDPVPAGNSANTPSAAAAEQPDAPLSVDEIRRAFTRVLPQSQRLLFFTPFVSYASVDEVNQGLQAAGYEAELSSRHAKLPERVPPNDLDTLRVANYVHLGVPGKLELQFFNDRLYQLEFEPGDAVAYRNKFRAQWPNLRREQSGRSEGVTDSLRIASSLDLAVSEVGQVLQSRPFVLWQDLRLVRQRDDWEIQFAREVTQ